MHVLVWLRSTPPRVVRFGPTSDQPALLASYDAPWPSGAETRAVLPVLPGVMLRVTRAVLPVLPGVMLRVASADVDAALQVELSCPTSPRDEP